MSRSLLAGLLLGLTALSATVAREQESAPEDDLAPRHRIFLEEVDLLMHDNERSAFLALSRDYQRDRFVQAFWNARDDYPQTPRNEFHERWSEHAEIARQRFDDLTDPRAQSILFFGPETSTFRASCAELLLPIDIWYFDSIAGERPEFYLVFLRLGGDRVNLWSPREGIGRLHSPSVPFSLNESMFLSRVAATCPRGDSIVNALLSSADWEGLTHELEVRTADDQEWVAAFRARSTDVPEDAVPLEARVSWDFPGSHQSRTIVQMMLSVAVEDVEIGTLGERSSYNFIVDGEILRRGEFFDDFRYKFDIPVFETARVSLPVRWPLAIQRYLRPGDYTWIVKLEDLNSKATFRREIELQVPNPRLAPERQSLPAIEPDGEIELWSEANAALENSDSGEHTLKLQAPADRLLTGQTRVAAVTTGQDIAKVAFNLNGKPVMTKSRPPYSVEINLGHAPRTHTLEAIAVARDGGSLARDEVLLNSGPHRFDIRLIEPQRGHSYSKSVRARAEVAVPETEILHRVEFFLNEDLLATLYQPPFVQPIRIPEGQTLGFVRAVAYLADGNSTEDLVFVNSPYPIDSLAVQFVELYASVFDSKGNPATDLTVEDFVVEEEGVEQQIRRFTPVTERPIHAGILLDSSSSMVSSMEEAQKAALQFFESVIRERDRASLITFADQPELVVPFTNDVQVLAGGLAGLVAEGETVLHDSVVFALHYFSGLRGKRALVLISDGEDVGSEYDFEEALEYARRAGVGIYTVGLQIPSNEINVRNKLSRLARETGGRSFLIEGADELRSVYSKIENELRSQYLIAYQSSLPASRGGFREIKLKISRKGFEAKTMRGYYP